MCIAADTCPGSTIPVLQPLSHNKKTERNINTNMKEMFKREGEVGRKEERNGDRKNE
jgi:hypothetical protein